MPHATCHQLKRQCQRAKAPTRRTPTSQDACALGKGRLRSAAGYACMLQLAVHACCSYASSTHARCLAPLQLLTEEGEEGEEVGGTGPLYRYSDWRPPWYGSGGS
jgi:hypothetical protein